MAALPMEMVAVSLQEVTPVQFFRARSLGLIQAVMEHFGLTIIFHAVISRYARIAFLEPADGLQYLARFLGTHLIDVHRQ